MDLFIFFGEEKAIFYDDHFGGVISFHKMKVLCIT